MSGVTNVARGLLHQGIRPGDRVAVRMGPRPSLLSLVTAIGRIGAVVVLASPGLDPEAWRQVLDGEPIRAVITDPEGAAEARRSFDGEVMVLGGGGAERALDVDGVIDLEAVDLTLARWPGVVEADAGQARDLAFVMVRPGAPGRPRVARVTNRRWAFSALGAASTTALIPEDTVYCPLPIHHPPGSWWRSERPSFRGRDSRLRRVSKSMPFGGTCAAMAPRWCFMPATWRVPWCSRRPCRASADTRSGRSPVAVCGRTYGGSFRSALGSASWSSTLRPSAISSSATPPVESVAPLDGCCRVASRWRWCATTSKPASSSAGRVGWCAPTLESGALRWRARPVTPRDPMSSRLPSRPTTGGGAPATCSTATPTGTTGLRTDSGTSWPTSEGPQRSTEVEQALLEGVPQLAQAAVFMREGQIVAAVVGPDITPEVLDQALSQLPPPSRPELVLWAEALPLTDGYRPLKSALRDGEPLMLRGSFTRAPEGYRPR